MLPGESFVRAIVKYMEPRTAAPRLWPDVSMAVIAKVLSFVFAYHLDGVREGTIIAALVGFIARFFGKN